ncbi:unnamed protein product [Orchesella dallaii]|uniref:Peptidase S1 domain-containing protein n=1 Tax=Orchesella dallaii TaxID=48710 RepID=A0ABP1R1Y8_9HEXA
MKLFVVVLGSFLVVSSCFGSPVLQDEGDVSTLASLQDDLETTVSPGIDRRQGLLEDIPADETVATTEYADVEAALSDSEVENEIASFKYPIEPEVALADMGDIQYDEEPLDARLMEEAGIRVVKREEDATPYYAGRAKCQCGRPGERQHPLRIVNGTVVRINDYPWTVALIRKRWIGRPKGAYCGGTLINSRYVVTASHCVDGMVASGIEVWVHEEDFSTQTETEGGTQKFGVERIIMHPYYSRKTIDNDIALIKLSDPVELDGVIVPACLPANNDYSFDGVLATAAGWGATEEGGPVSKQLLKVDVPVISNDDCNTKTQYNGKITENMLCAGYVEEGGKDSCQGDSGGPLVIPNGGRTTLVGVVSWGYGCARPGAPGVYTRVGRYPEWIVKNSNGADWCEI